MYGRARRYWDNFNSTDPVTQGIAIVALVLLAIFALPYFNFPWQASGGACTDMAPPLVTGSNQSILAEQEDPNKLLLELAPTTISISPGSDLKVGVRFINESVAPFTLYLPANTGIFRYTTQESGILFSVQSAGRVYGEPASVRPPAIGPQSYSAADLHVLRPRSRCTFDVTIEANRLAAAQVTNGTYQIVAVYRNQYKGLVPAPGALTPTPMFPDLGVWTGQVQSNNQLILTIGPQAAPASK